MTDRFRLKGITTKRIGSKSLCDWTSLISVAVFLLTNLYAYAGASESAVFNGLVAQGSGYIKKGEFEEARQSFQEATDYARQKFGPSSGEYGMATGFLGLTFVRLGADDIAEVLLIKAQVILGNFPKFNSSQMTVSSALADIYRKQGKMKDAGDALRHSIGISEKHFGPNHLDVAKGLGELTLLLSDAGKNEEAIPLAKRELQIEMARLEPGDSLILGTIEFLAYLYIAAVDYVHAQEVLEKAIAAMDSVVGREDMRVARLESLLGLAYSRDGRIGEALPCHERALKIAKRTFDPGDPKLAIHYVKVAHCLAELGRNQLADTAYAVAIDIFSKASSVPGGFDVRRCMQEHAKVLRKLGKTRQADELEKKAQNVPSMQ